MQTECSADLFGFAPVEGRKVVAAFDGGTMTSEAGAILLGATDGQIRLIERFAGCFTDHRAADLVVHEVASLVGQRVFGIALGYEDLIDHDQLRHDPVMAVLGGKLEARRADCAPLAGKSTLNRLELSRPEPTRYHKISYDAAAIEGLFVELFLDAHSAPPPQITLDLDATDDPLHGHQEDRFFHGYYDTYCYLPLYVFCGRHLLASKLRPANIDASAGSVEEVARIIAQIRRRWPKVRVLLRADSGFARGALMAWCEDNDVDFLFGLAKNARLAPAYVGVDKKGKYLFSAEYTGAWFEAFPINANGSLGPAVFQQFDADNVGPMDATNAPPGSFAISAHEGPNGHPHQMDVDPSNKWVLGPERGARPDLRVETDPGSHPTLDIV